MRNLFHYDMTKLMIKLKDYLSNVLDKKNIIVILLGVTLCVLSVFMVGHKSTLSNDTALLQKQRNEIVLRKLNEINDTLIVVKNNPIISKQQQIALQNLEKEISSLQKSIVEVAKASDVQKVSSQITSIKDDVDTQISELKKAISETKGNKQYLDISTLPFHVAAVDVIAGQPYVSVDYANHFVPLAIGDVLSGWRVSNADYDSGTAEFVNEKNQYINTGKKDE